MKWATLLKVEVRRALHRRLTWTLVALALAGIALFAVIAFAGSTHMDPEIVHAKGDHHPAILTDWWISHEPDNVLNVAAVFLLLGALVGGASVVGAEWRAGTVTTVLTWEPVRIRVFFARVTAATVCAVTIALALQLVMLAAALPAILLHGSTAGVDGDWYVGFGAALVRISLLAGATTALGAALTFIARNTAGAVIAVWAWMIIVENLVRAHRPNLAHYLLSENLIRVIGWADADGSPVHRGPSVAAVTVVAYLAVVVTVSVVHFRRADITSG